MLMQQLQYLPAARSDDWSRDLNLIHSWTPFVSVLGMAIRGRKGCPALGETLQVPPGMVSNPCQHDMIS
jgi:hypothetical protein